MRLTQFATTSSALLILLAFASTGVSKDSVGKDRGFIARKYVDHVGIEHDYVLFVPYDFNANSNPPVLMALNGFGDNGDDGISHIYKYFGPDVWKMRSFFPFVAFAPQCKKDGSWSLKSNDTRFALDVLAKILDEFRADEDRVYLTGVSSGARGAIEIAAGHPDRFAAVVPLSSSGIQIDAFAKAKLPIWCFCNDNDNDWPVERVRNWRQKLIESGLSPKFTEYHRSGHDTWTAAYNSTALYGWLLQQRRSINQGLPEFKYLRPAQLLNDWSAHGAGKWSVDREHEDWIVGHCEPAGAPASLISAASRQFELHADVWIQSGQELRLSVSTPDNLEATCLATISLRLNDEGTSALIGPRGEGTKLVIGQGTAGSECLTRIDAAAQRSMRTDFWTDIRLKIKNETLTIDLNGWPAAELSLQFEAGKPSSFQIALIAHQTQYDVRYRFVRFRELE